MEKDVRRIASSQIVHTNSDAFYLYLAAPIRHATPSIGMQMQIVVRNEELFRFKRNHMKVLGSVVMKAFDRFMNELGNVRVSQIYILYSHFCIYQMNIMRIISILGKKKLSNFLFLHIRNAAVSIDAYIRGSNHQSFFSVALFIVIQSIGRRSQRESFKCEQKNMQWCISNACEKIIIGINVAAAINMKYIKAFMNEIKLHFDRNSSSHMFEVSILHSLPMQFGVCADTDGIIVLTGTSWIATSVYPQQPDISGEVSKFVHSNLHIDCSTGIQRVNIRCVCVWVCICAGSHHNAII